MNTREILHSLKQVELQSRLKFRVHPVSSIAERIYFGLIRRTSRKPNPRTNLAICSFFHPAPFPMSSVYLSLFYSSSHSHILLLYESLLPQTLAMFLTVFVACLPVLASAAPLFPRSNLGNATYYAPNLPTGTCSFSTYTLPAGIFGSALSDSNWNNAANCGACVSVTVSNGSTITAMVFLPP